MTHSPDPASPASALPTEPYLAQHVHWPQCGEHILAHHDDSSVVVYQAYRPAIGQFAIENGHLCGPDFSLARMSWIKPNFLWMMYRSSWGTKEGQEVILGLRLRRAFFDAVLSQAVSSSYDPACHSTRDEWQAAVASSEVRLQWDPDHSPSGAKLARRAVQLGLRGSMLKAFAKDELLQVIDMTGFVAAQRPLAQDANPDLHTPVEQIYRPTTHKHEQGSKPM
jgi:hypothetical protein